MRESGLYLRRALGCNGQDPANAKKKTEAGREWQASQQRGREGEEGLQVDLGEELVHLRHLAKLFSAQFCALYTIRKPQAASLELQPCIRAEKSHSIFHIDILGRGLAAGCSCLSLLKQ